jgi:hypothetical protein
MSRFTIESARCLLYAAGVFYPCDASDPDEDVLPHTLNMNDTWGWAVAWCEVVPDENLVEVATLFTRYGDGGLLYWTSKRHGWMRSEFADVNRKIDFVWNEESIRAAMNGNSNKLAYHKEKYAIGNGALWTDFNDIKEGVARVLTSGI